ncbi:MAG TPA: flagellar basal body P-ring formation chaperone FlgA [Solimonas sp.]|nr:flagellar basal body P-ring formation chaperone FlgA [Solimonas sp.]
MSQVSAARRITVRLALACACMLAPAARAGDAIEPLDRIRRVAEAAVRKNLPPTAEVSADAIDPRLRLPVCASAPDAEAGAARGASASVTVRCAAPETWTLYVPVRIRDLRPVLVLTRAVRRGEIVDASALRSETRDVAQLPFGYVSDAATLAGNEFRRPVGAGQAISPADVEPERCIRRGDLVTLIGRAAGIEVRAEGKAMADGGRGSRIRVQNSRSKRIVEGTITAPGVVEL